MPVIEGTYGPFFLAADPVNGTNETQTLTVGATPTSGTFKLGYEGFVTPAITWHATTSTFLANINAVLSGVAEVQRLTIGGTPTGGTFRLAYKGQPTANITWSATDATLQTNVDNALEALGHIGTTGVATTGADGTMNDGIGYLVLTWPGKGPKDLLTVYENNLAGTSPTVAVTRTTTGYYFPPLGPDGVVATDVDLSGGVGNVLLTFSGAHVAKKAQQLMTIADNALVGEGATLVIEETTAGVTASSYGAPANAVMLANGHLYMNQGTAAAPSWTQQPYSVVASYPKTTTGAQTLMAAALHDRTVMILVVITETFAAGNGAATIFSFGETDSATKFKNGLTTGTAADVLTYGGTLSAGKALLCTATAATGTGAGAVSVMAVVAA